MSRGITEKSTTRLHNLGS